MTTVKKNIVLKGIAASPGMAFGEARVIFSARQSIEERLIQENEIENEISRLEKSIENTMAELREYSRKAGQRIGGPVARIFETQLMIASDNEFLKKVKEEIRASRKNADYIYSLLVEKSLMPLRVSRDPYMRQMVYDIEAVANRILDHLAGIEGQDLTQAPQNCVFVGKRFSPAELLGLYERQARAVVTTGGSPNSHMALVARSLLIPAVVGVSQAHLKINSGDRVIVDGETGLVTVNPPDKEWAKLRGKESDHRTLPLARLKKLPRFPLKTKDNVEIKVAANITLPGPLDKTLAERGLGVGLYRTEFLYLQNGRFPSEDKQFEIYDHVAGLYHPHPVVMRTFDLGSDKILEEENAHRENNPALGWRGIRSMLEMPKEFRDQIKAMLRASARGNVRLLLPMITDITEVKKSLALIRRCMTDLDKSKTKYDHDIKIGIMIEVPAAALAADSLAPLVDFFSIGSNDLTQYTLAADRDNRKLVRLFNPIHPAVLRLIKTTVEAARRSGIPVTVCGEMSGDLLTIPLLIGLGVEELSMSPARLNNAASVLPKLNYSEAVLLAEEILACKTPREIERKLLDFNMAL